MISFIIPIIHPQHKYISNYQDILNHLQRTLINLSYLGKNIKVIVICHKKPNWYKDFSKYTTFIVVNSQLFNILKHFDDGSLKYQNVNTNYINYLKLRGQYHNKDKGLKYFIGLLYLSRLKHPPKFVGIIDGDDFIHDNLLQYLEKQPDTINEFFFKKGYLMFAYGSSNILKIDSIYKINNFTNICGSNRVFRYNHLMTKIKSRLNYSFSNFFWNDLTKKLVIKELGILEIMTHVQQTPLLWNILPAFLGVHRLFVDNQINHKFHLQFNIAFIPYYVAVKLVHNNGHCTKNNKFNKKAIIKKYIKNNIISDPNYLDNLNKIIKSFHIQDVNVIQKI
jgi:hypothetical protein